MCSNTTFDNISDDCDYDLYILHLVHESLKSIKQRHPSITRLKAAESVLYHSQRNIVDANRQQAILIKRGQTHT